MGFPVTGGCCCFRASWIVSRERRWVRGEERSDLPDREREGARAPDSRRESPVDDRRSLGSLEGSLEYPESSDTDCAFFLREDLPLFRLPDDVESYPDFPDSDLPGPDSPDRERVFLLSLDDDHRGRSSR